MLIRLVSAVLRRFLGRYVENLDEDKFSYSIYQGHVVLTDLTLKTEALTHLLGLPIKLRSGTIGKVLLQIPITQLRSQPWSITIENVRLCVCPNEEEEEEDNEGDNLTVEEDCATKMARIAEARKAYLDRLEKRWWQVVKQGGLAGAAALASTDSPVDSSWWSYGISLAYGIVRNLQVEIKNVHFSLLDEKHSIIESSQSLAWGVRLEQLSAHTTDEKWESSSSQVNQQIEFKSIDIVGLSVYWLSDGSLNSHADIDDILLNTVSQIQYLLPPSHFSIHAMRRTTPEPLTSSEPRIEVHAKLTHLHLQVSKTALISFHQLVNYASRQMAMTRRPRKRPSKAPRAWWLYAACEVVPLLTARLASNNLLFKSALNLDELAKEATRTNRYVRAYERHLLKSLDCQLEDENEESVLKEEEETMQMERVTLLRQIAMQLAARRLRTQASRERKLTNQDLMPPTPLRKSPSSSTSWWPSFLSSTSSTTTEIETKFVDESANQTAAAPWRLWWWFASTSNSGEDLEASTSLQNEADMIEGEEGSSSSTSSSEAAAQLLLNELVASDADVGQVLTRDLIFCRITCAVEQCRLGFTVSSSDVGEINTLSFFSIAGDSLHFGLETRPRYQSLRFTVGLQSLTMTDERRRNNKKPLFPLVVVPQTQTHSKCLSSSSNPSGGLFWLAYESYPPDGNALSSLEIRTDPLRVVYQHELCMEIAKYFRTARTSQGYRVSTYDRIVARTEANFRAAMHTAETADHVPTKSTLRPFSPITVVSRNNQSSGKTRPSLMRWRIALDIAAPKILLPDRFWPNEDDFSSAVVGVLCDFGRFRLSNWQPSVEGNSPTPVTESTCQIDGEKSIEDDEFAFATPCASPNASDDEADAEANAEEPYRLCSQRRVKERMKPMTVPQLYETYMLQLDELRVLAGRLDELQLSGLWPDFVIPTITSPINTGLPSRRSGPPSSVTISRVHLIDRFSLSVWITRRIVRLADIPLHKLPTFQQISTEQPGIPSDLPGFLIAWEQRDCCLRLSDEKIAAVKKCLLAPTLVSTAGVEPPSSEQFSKLLKTSNSRRRRALFSEQRKKTQSICLGDPPSISDTHPDQTKLEMRRRIVVTFSMEELTLQLDYKDRPLAECRLGRTAARFSRLTDGLDGNGAVEYQVRAQVHSLTIADALAGLGGDFDLLAASHRGVRLDTLSGNLSVAADANTLQRRSRLKPGSQSFCQSKIINAPSPFFDPFTEDHDSETALIRVKYVVTLADNLSSCATRKLGVKFRCLDLLGNLETLHELVSFARKIFPETASMGVEDGGHLPMNTSLIKNAVTELSHKDSEETKEDQSSPGNIFEVLVTVERLSLVLIRVRHLKDPDVSLEPSLHSKQAEHLATVSLLGASFDCHRGDTELYMISLAGAQVLDLTASGKNHRHIFAAGSCLDPELENGNLLPQSTPTIDEPVLSVTCYRDGDGESEGYHFQANVANPVYIHKPQALHDISAWLSSLPRLATGVARRLKRRLKFAAGHVARKVIVQPAASSQQTSSFASFSVSLAQPVLVLPEAPSGSPRVLICRLGQLQLAMGDAFGGGRSNSFLATIEHASLSSLDIESGVPMVWGTSEAVKAMLGLAHYRGIVRSKSEILIIEDVSANLKLSRCVVSAPPTRETDIPFNWPSDFDTDIPYIPFQSSELSSKTVDSNPVLLTQATDDGSSLTWLIAEACLIQPLHVRLTKPVYQQIMNSIDNLVLEDDDDEDEEEGEDSLMNETVLHEENQLEEDEEQEDNVLFTSILGLQDDDNEVDYKADPPSASGLDITTPVSNRVARRPPCLALHFRLPRLVVETFANLDVHPIGLTRLTLCEFRVTWCKLSTSGVKRLEANLASLCLENLLPDLTPSKTKSTDALEDRFLLYSRTTTGRQSAVPSTSGGTKSMSISPCLPASRRIVRWQNSRGWVVAGSCPSLNLDADNSTSVTVESVSKSLQKSSPHPNLSYKCTQSRRRRLSASEAEYPPPSASASLSNTATLPLNVQVHQQIEAGNQFVRIRVVFVDPKRAPHFVRKFDSKRRFVDIAFTSLICRLSLHPWVLLFDFLGFGSPLSTCDDFTRPSIHPQTASKMLGGFLSSNEDNVAVGDAVGEEEEEEEDVITLSVTSFVLVLSDTTTTDVGKLLANQQRQVEVDFVRLSATSLSIYLLSHPRRISEGGDWMLVKGELRELLIEDLSSTGHLYPQRLITAPVTTATTSIPTSFLTFELTRFQLPDPELNRRTEDSLLLLRLAPAYYVHTQVFLCRVMDALDTFLNYQDLMNRVRAGSEGFQIRTRAPLSTRIRLNVVAHAPIVVVPVSAASDSVLVCDLGNLTAKNQFLWDGEQGSLSAEEKGKKKSNKESEQDCVKPSKMTTGFMQSRNLDDCQHCIAGSSYDKQTDMPKEDSPSTCVNRAEFLNRKVAKQTPFDILKPRDFNSFFGSDFPSEERCLLDCISLDLKHIDIYIGRRRPAILCSKTNVETGRILHFRDFCITPLKRKASSKQQQQPWQLLTDPFELDVRIERNLAGARSKASPDWRLSACLHLLNVHVEQADLGLLKGILTHNLSGEDGLVGGEQARTSPQTSRNTQRLQITPTGTQPAYKVIAFQFDLQDVSINLSLPPPSAFPPRPSKDNEPINENRTSISFCRLDFISSQVAYNSYSDGRRHTDLSCSAVTFTDTRFNAENVPNTSSPNRYTTILTSMSKAEDEHLQHRLSQFRITNAVSPGHSCLTYYLRSMRLILAFDWLCDLHRFLTTPSDNPGSTSGRTLTSTSSVPHSKCATLSKGDETEDGAWELSELRVYSDQTEFILLENPTEEDTDAVILTGATCFRHVTTTRVCNQQTHLQPSSTLGLRLHGVAVHTGSGVEQNHRVVIIEPADVDIQISPEASSSRTHSHSGLQDLIVPRATLRVCTSALRTHFSYTDSELFLGLLSSLQEQASSAFKTNVDVKPRPTRNFTLHDASIARLVEMGFSAEQAAIGLHRSKGHVSSAILQLTSPLSNSSLESTPPSSDLGDTDPDEISSKAVKWLKQLFSYIAPSISAVSFTSNFSLCLIDDCLDADVPLAEFILSDISVHWCLTGWAVGRGKAKLAVNYYNRDLSALEPAIEPFLGILDWRLKADRPTGDCAIFEIYSPDTININLTVPLVRLTRLIVEKTHRASSSSSGRISRKRVPFVPFCLSNQTGSLLWFKPVTETTSASSTIVEKQSIDRLANDLTVQPNISDWISVKPDGSTVDLPFLSAMSLRTISSRGDARRYHRTPRLLLQVAGWQAAYPVAVDRLGIFFRTILLDSISHSASCVEEQMLPPLPSVTRLVIEVVRRGSAQNLIVVRSGLTLTNHLSPNYNLEVGLLLPTSAEFSVKHKPMVLHALDVAFAKTAAVPLNLAARASLGVGRFCFRPVWSGAVNRDDKRMIFSWSQQIRCQIDSTEDEYTVVTRKRSTVQPIAAGDSEDGLDWLRLKKPGDFTECLVICRRLTLGSELGLLSVTSADDNATTGKPISLCRGGQAETKSWQLCVAIARDAFPPDPRNRKTEVSMGQRLLLPGHHFTIGPVLRLVNLLPCELTYFFEGTPLKGRLAVNACTSICEIGCSDTIRFGVHLDGFERCDTLTIPPSSYAHSVLMRLIDIYGRPLELRVDVKTRAFGARHLTVNAVCWLVNQSSLPLVFAQSAPSTLASIGELEAPRGSSNSSSSSSSSGRRALAAGQWAEQEMARLASPLLFSFINKDVGAHVQVRIGSRFDPSGGQHANATQPILTPRWSPSIALDKTGVDLLQLRLKSSADRPDLLYSIGVEVRKGRGPHAGTTILTFTPRFVISNQTDLRLQFAQRFCLDSHAHKSAVVDAHPHCSLPFHWPRQDLDQLLCLRALVTGESRFGPSSSHSTPSSDPEFVATHWSGGVQIDQPCSYHLMLRLPNRPSTSMALLTNAEEFNSLLTPESLFIRVSIVLRSATFFIIVSDASQLPPPYRIENASPVALFYQQQAILGGGSRKVDALDARSGKNHNGWWSGGVVQSTLAPRCTVDYAPEEPLLPPILNVGVQGGLSCAYDLNRLGAGPRLVYDNYVYLSICGIADDVSVAFKAISDIGFEYPVFDVTPRSKRIVLNFKRPGERSQLWYLSPEGYIVHEGSMEPRDPGTVPALRLSKRSWVLDVDLSNSAAGDAIKNHVPSIDTDTLQQFEIGILSLAPYSKRRQATQTWTLGNRGYLTNTASFCVQAARQLIYRSVSSGGPRLTGAYRHSVSVGHNLAFSDSNSSLPCLLGGSVLVARPRKGAQCLVSRTLSTAWCQYSWLRPGSGSLEVEITTDGPVKILRISDPNELDFPTVIHKSKSAPSSHNNNHVPIGPTCLKLLLDFPAGIGLSVVSSYQEELCYISLIGLRLSLDRFYPPTNERLQLTSTENRSSSSAHNFEFGEELGLEVETENDVGSDSVFDDSVVIDKTILPEHYSAEEININRKSKEQVRVHIGRIQIDSQFPGASLPILLFRSPGLNSSSIFAGEGARNIVQGNPVVRDAEWIAGRELARLLGPREDGSVSSEPLFMPTIVSRHIRLLHTGWQAQIFTLFEFQVNRLIVQAEELLLLKLIQFGRNFTEQTIQRVNGSICDTSVSTTMDGSDVRQLDLLLSSNSASFPGEVEGTYARQLSPPQMDSMDFLYFGKLRVHLAPLRVTMQTAKGSLGPQFHDVKRLLPKLMSFADADLRLGGFEREHFLERGRSLIDQLCVHFQLQLRTQALSIFGSVDFLGNPLGFMHDLSTGISGLVEMDVGGLFRNVAHGVGDSTAKVVDSVSQLVHAISFDERHQRQRTAILASEDNTTDASSQGSSGQSQSVTHAAALSSAAASEIFEDFEVLELLSTAAGNKRGNSNNLALVRSGASVVVDDGRKITAPLQAGFRGFVHGVFGGVTSMVTQPYHGVKEDSLTGFVYGVGRGLLGTVAKPVGGVLDLVSGAMTTLREAARSSSDGRPRRLRPRRAGLSIHQTPLRPYSLASAIGQLQLRRLAVTLPPPRYNNNNHRDDEAADVDEVAEEVGGSNVRQLTQPVNQYRQQPVSSLLAATSWSIATPPPHLREGDVSEVVIRLLPCQARDVSVIVTDRAVWCIRNLAFIFPSASSQNDSYSSSASVRMGTNAVEKASIMFVIPYRRLDSVHICPTPSTPISSSSSPSSSSSSTYVEFLGDRWTSRRVLRFDRSEWAVELVLEVGEAHFRFVQTAMTLNRVAMTTTDLELLNHPLALPFAPPVETNTPDTGNKKL